MFGGRRLCIATKHQKERVIAPVLEAHLGVTCFTPVGLDTDLLGTFSGEIERIGTPLETALQKCMEAMHITGCDLAVASEGSFGPHPTIGFAPCNEEILLLYDTRHQLKIYAREISLTTNFSGGEFTDAESLHAFAKTCLFPSHGLIIKDSQGAVIAKGICDWDTLNEAFYMAKERGWPVKAETDMRAQYNPTRMGVIKKAADKLAEAATSRCPNCALPGFVATVAEPGLPCAQCGMPTRSIRKHIAVCKGCNHRHEILYPHHKQSEDPAYCDFCNP